MTGTSGAAFIVVLSNAAGELGYRPIESGRYRLRLEPRSGYAVNLPNWKQPGTDGQNRYSVVVAGIEGLAQALATSAAALQAAANGD